MSGELAILLAEDSPHDALLIEKVLRRQGLLGPWQVVETREELAGALRSSPWDVVLTDHALPDFNSLDVVDMVAKEAPGTPVVLVSGAIGEVAVMQAAQAGVHEFVPKDRLDALPHAIDAARAAFADRKRAEQAIRALYESERRAKAFVEHLPVGLVLGDTKGVAIDVNPELCRMLGRPRDEIIGSSWVDLVDAQDQARLRSALPTLWRGATKSLGSLRLAQPHGGELWVDANATLIPAAAGDDAQVLAYLLDITRRMRVEEERALAIRMATASDRLAGLGTLVAGVAHEINNPLMYLRGNVEIMRMVVDDILHAPDLAHAQQAAADLDRSAEMALRGLDRIAAIAKGLHVVSRPSTGVMASVDANQVVEEVLAVASPRIGPGVDVHSHLQAKERVTADAGQLSQVLLNLLFNAGDALRSQDTGHITVATRDTPETLLIEVSDDGPGIPPEVQGMIFTPFFTTKAEGTGLGLSISKAIVEAHGGTLTFRPHGERGTTFEVRLPRGGAPATA